MKRFAVAALALALALTGCGSAALDGTGTAEGTTKAVLVALPDGRAVTCVTYGYHGIDCDWDGAR